MAKFRAREILKLAVSLVIVFIAAGIGSITTISQISTWYASLVKPAWAPPNWVFGPVWTILFLLIGIALFLVWKEGVQRREVKFALIIFTVQLVLNVLWSVVFFGFHSILGSFILIIILWMVIVSNIIIFYVISKPAGIILVPYLIWVTIASYLNYAVYILNP